MAAFVRLSYMAQLLLRTWNDGGDATKNQVIDSHSEQMLLLDSSPTA